MDSSSITTPSSTTAPIAIRQWGRHPGAVQPDGVTEGHVIPDLHRVGPVDVDDGAVLDVRVMADADPVHVGPDHAVEPHARVRPQLHVADDVPLSSTNAISWMRGVLPWNTRSMPAPPRIADGREVGKGP